MGRVLTILAAVAVVVLGTAGPALAKGPDQATITGPGLAEPIVVADGGEPGMAGNLSDLAEKSGLYLAMFNDPGARAAAVQQPAGHLGPKYQIAYRVPADGTESVRQDLYPSAAGGPLTYTPAGQSVFGSTPVISGWFRGEAGLDALLTRLGVPGGTVGSPTPSRVPRVAEVPARHRGNVTPWVLAGVAVVLCLLVAAGVLRSRRATAART
jgi:hypothetical protein